MKAECKTGYVKWLQKSQNIFACILTIVKKAMALVFPALLFPSIWLHEQERQNDKVCGGHREELSKKLKFCCLLLIQTKPDNSSTIGRMWLVGWILWHINHYRLFNAKSSLYIYIKYIWFSLVVFLWHINHYRLFNAKSSLYIYIRYMICKCIVCW